MIEWALATSAVAAGVMLVLWLKERQESKDLRLCCNTMAEMYERARVDVDKLAADVDRIAKQQTVHEQSARWLN